MLASVSGCVIIGRSVSMVGITLTYWSTLRCAVYDPTRPPKRKSHLVPFMYCNPETSMKPLDTYTNHLQCMYSEEFVYVAQVFIAGSSEWRCELVYSCVLFSRNCFVKTSHFQHLRRKSLGVSGCFISASCMSRSSYFHR